MEPKLQEWIFQTVLVETEKHLFTVKAPRASDLKQNSFQGSTRGYVNILSVHSSGTRIVQIIDVGINSQKVLYY
jgi:hypothetical protein